MNNDIIKRAAKTFIQAFLGTLVVSVATVNDWPTARAALIGAAAAALSFTWNTIVAKKDEL